MQNKIIDVIPLPTDQDAAQIQAIIDEYERQFPGRIKKLVRQAKRDEAYQVGGKKNVDPYLRKGTTMKLTKLAELPIDLTDVLRQRFPNIFRSKDNFRWFVKQFPIFQVPDKLDF